MATAAELAQYVTTVTGTTWTVAEVRAHLEPAICELSPGWREVFRALIHTDHLTELLPLAIEIACSTGMDEATRFVVDATVADVPAAAVAVLEPLLDATVPE